MKLRSLRGELGTGRKKRGGKRREMTRVGMLGKTEMRKRETKGNASIGGRGEER